MDIQQLHYFVTAVELGSLSEAAKALGVSQPAVTKGLRKLELELDAPLLERGTSGVRTTPYGDSFLPHARAMLGQLDQGTRSIGELRGESAALLAIGTTPSFVDALLPRALGAFGRGWPQVRLRVVKALAPALLTMVRSGELDLAFMLQTDGELPGGLDHLPIADMEVVFLARRGHPLAGESGIELGRLAASRWILLDSPDVHRYFAARFETAATGPPAPAVLTNSMRLIKTTILESDLVGFLPRHMIAAELASGELVELDADVAAGTCAAGLVCRPGARRAVVDAFIRVALDVARAEGSPAAAGGAAASPPAAALRVSRG